MKRLTLVFPLGMLVLAGCEAAPLAPAPDLRADAEAAAHRTSAPPAEFVIISLPQITVYIDAQIGTASIQLAGEVGGPVHGHMSLRIGGSHAAAGLTEYIVLLGSLAREGPGYRWWLQGDRIVPGEGPARSFSSELVLNTGETPADGDVWIIDGLRCQFDKGDLICL